MAISSLRSHVRADNLSNQARASQSLARRLYLGVLLVGICWIVMQFVGPFLLMDADGLVVQERAVVMPAYTAEITSLTVKPGDAVTKGQTIGTLISTEMVTTIGDLTAKEAQARERQEQIKSRLQAIESTMPAAEQRVKDSQDAVVAVAKAKQRGFATVTHQSEVSQERFVAVRELASLQAEKRSLKSEAEGLNASVARLSTALDKAIKAYHNGEIISPVSGTVGPKVAADGTVLRPADSIAEIYHGPRYVVAYLPTGRLFSIHPGQAVVVTDGLIRSSGKIEGITAITDKMPPEFQSNFRSVERQQVVRVSLDDDAAFPLLSKIKVMHPHAPSNLIAEAGSFVAAGVRAFMVSAPAAPLKPLRKAAN
jgi:multidrug resistance efflux pump